MCSSIFLFVSSFDGVFVCARCACECVCVRCNDRKNVSNFVMFTDLDLVIYGEKRAECEI